jgi:hypothetical protein
MQKPFQPSPAGNRIGDIQQFGRVQCAANARPMQSRMDIAYAAKRSPALKPFDFHRFIRYFQQPFDFLKIGAGLELLCADFAEQSGGMFGQKPPDFVIFERLQHFRVQNCPAPSTSILLYIISEGGPLR